ncbi:MAG: hypothetical protein HFF90_06095 [Oscillibacter sp.]|nr:hypothetical protein [Oscillibacter sp.]
MDGPVFDALLKTALEEAIRLDAEEAAPAPSRPSPRHRRRMRRMLADPWGYARGVRPNGTWKGSGRRGRFSARWLAAVVIAALLTGTAAAYALRGGETFRQMFENSPWADAYGGASDTEQLLDLGGSLNTAVVESDGLRFEMLDAVSDGQMAMVSVRLTVLEKLEEIVGANRGISFGDMEIVSKKGKEIGMYGLSISPWTSEGHEDLEEGQYALIFTINDLALTEGGQYEIRIKDVVAENRKPLLPGAWTLALTLRPAQVLELRPNRVCRLNGADWTLDSLTLSPLAMTMEFSHQDGGWDHHWNFLDEISLNLRNGLVVDDCSTGAYGSDTELGLTLEFHMPMDVSQIRSVTICGEEIPLQPAKAPGDSQIHFGKG